MFQICSADLPLNYPKDCFLLLGAQVPNPERSGFGSTPSIRWLESGAGNLTELSVPRKIYRETRVEPVQLESGVVKCFCVAIQF